VAYCLRDGGISDGPVVGSGSDVPCRSTESGEIEMSSGFSTFIPVVAGSAGAAGLIGVGSGAAAFRHSHVRLGDHVKAGTAWSASDSWVTNIAAFASVVAVIWTQLGTGSPSLVPGAAAPAAGILFVSFGATAGLAPVVYAACAPRSGLDADTNVGSVTGYLLAAFATLFAIIGQGTLLGMFTAEAMPAGAARNILEVVLGGGALAVVVYSVRTINDVLAADTTGQEAKPKVRSPATSLLVPAARRSATL
jgi:hypothetical protein